MNSVVLIFPHQLFHPHPYEGEAQFVLVEEFLFFKQYPFHQQKLIFHRSSMQAYAERLKKLGKKVNYIGTVKKGSDVRDLGEVLQQWGIQKVFCCEMHDQWLESRLKASLAKHQLNLELRESPMFLHTEEELRSYFEDKKRMFQTDFYIHARKKNNILLEKNGSPLGGKWSFDAENRLRYPKEKTPPQSYLPDDSSFFQEAKSYVQNHFPNNPGQSLSYPIYPHDRGGALYALYHFLEHRFAGFGPYEDAIVASSAHLHHSVLTPMLNVGLITPHEVLQRTIAYASEHQIPLASLEGFVRQIMGWREFIRAVYLLKGRTERTKNYWGFHRKIPASFWNGTTGIAPIDLTIRKVLRSGYCHHIERLMVLGNFMLLCEFDPDEVYVWFMSLFIDSYDWVMVPNIYGMSQFADGGLMSTKPYISGSNYLMKMSDYPKGDWQQTWDALFWRFMHVHRDFFLSNPRLGMLVRSFDKMEPSKQEKLLQQAALYIQGISEL